MQGNAREGGRGHSLGQAPLSEYVKKFILGIPGYWDLEKTVLLCDGLCHKDWCAIDLQVSTELSRVSWGQVSKKFAPSV